MTSLTTLKSFSSADRTEVIAAEAALRPLGTNAYMNTHTRTRTCTHDARRQVAPLVLLSIHPSYRRTEHICTRTHAHIETDSEVRGCSDAGKFNEEYRDFKSLFQILLTDLCAILLFFEFTTETHILARRD